MSLDRRALLGALGAACAATTATAQTTTPAPAPPAPPRPSLLDRIAARALENRVRLAYDGRTFSGPGWDALLQAGRESQFFCIGEEHGIAENPKLAAQLFTALVPSGYVHACVEISAPLAADLDTAARGGLDGMRALFADPGSQVAFFGMRQESEWIVAARAAVRGRERMLWGLDYEVGGDRRLIARLKAKRKPAAAATALAALEQASAASWAQYAQTHGPQYIFSFAGDAALVRALRDAWPSRDDDTSLMLDVLEETLEINKLWVTGANWRSNERRAQFNRENLRRFWNAERAAGHAPRVMFKFGASHMVRGLSYAQVHDLGTQIAELAEANDVRSFHLMVLQGHGAPLAQFDPSAWTYRQSTNSSYDMNLDPLTNAAYPDAFTLIDLKPLRPLVFGNAHKALDPDLVRTIHGFDALLVMSGSTASENL